MLDKKSLSERDICTKFITPAIVKAGWDANTQFLEEVSFTDGKIYVRGKLHSRGTAKRADYILYYKPNIPIAIIEAKDNKHSIGAGLQQALDYSRILDIPFVFSSNGDGFKFHDKTAADGDIETELDNDSFPSPERLWEKYKKYKSIVTPDEEKIVEQSYYDDGSGRKPRYYQQIAINRTVENLFWNNDEIMTELSHQLELVSGLRQAFLREAMQGELVPQDASDEPAAVLFEKIKAEKEKLIAEKKIKNQKPLPEIKPKEIPFEIPNNWAWCRLGEVIELISGQHIETTDYNDKGEGFPYLTGPSDFGEKYLIPSRWTTKPKVFADKDDILITVKGSGVGKTNISNLEKVVISRQLMAIRTSFISRFYMHFFLDNSFDLLQSEKKGTGIPGISRENILEKVFPLPPLAEQKRIVEKLEKLMRFCDELELSIKQGIAHADGLLQVALKEALEPK